MQFKKICRCTIVVKTLLLAEMRKQGLFISELISCIDFLPTSTDIEYFTFLKKNKFRISPLQHVAMLSISKKRFQADEQIFENSYLKKEKEKANIPEPRRFIVNDVATLLIVENNHITQNYQNQINFSFILLITHRLQWMQILSSRWLKQYCFQHLVWSVNFTTMSRTIFYFNFQE